MTKRKPNGLTLISLLVLVLLCLFAVYPLLLLVMGSIREGVPSAETAEFSLRAWKAVLSEPRILAALLNTVLLGLMYTAISLPISVMISWLIARTDVPAAPWLEFGFWVSFFLPSLSVVQGWILLLDPSFGLINQGLREMLNGASSLGPFNIYSFGGIIFAHLITTAISAKVMLMTPVFRMVDSSLEEASRISGDTAFQTVRRIFLPIVAPTIIVVTVLGIIRSLESFEIELVLGTPPRVDVYSTLLYRLVQNDPPDYSVASALGVAIMLLMAVLVWLQFRAVRKSGYQTVGGKAQSRLLQLGRWRWIAFAFVVAVLLLLTVVPLLFMVAGTLMTMYGFFDISNAWTLMHWHEVLGDRVFVGSLGNTLKLSLGAACFMMVVGFGMAYVVVRDKSRLATVVDLLSWVPFSMPGVLFSLAFLWMVLSTPMMSAFYGSTILLILAVGMTTLTVGVQVIKSALMQLSKDLEESSFLSGASLLQTMWRIAIPLTLQSILVAGLMGFVTAGRSIGQLALLTTSDNRPLAILQLEYMVEGRYEAAAVVGTVVVGVTVGVALISKCVGLKAGVRR